MSEAVRSFWQVFQASHDVADPEPYDIFRVGNNSASADEGAKLILDGSKTATSALPEEFVDMPEPFVGALSVVLDGKDQPCAVVKTTGVETKPFAGADEDFARDYGEWDRTLETWLDQNNRYYEKVCERLNLEWSEWRPLIFERFEVVFPTVPPSNQQAGGM